MSLSGETSVGSNNFVSFNQPQLDITAIKRKKIVAVSNDEECSSKCAASNNSNCPDKIFERPEVIEDVMDNFNKPLNSTATKSLAEIESSLSSVRPLPSCKLLRNYQSGVAKNLASAMLNCNVTSVGNDRIPSACLKYLKTTNHKTKSGYYRWQRSVCRKWVDDSSFRKEVKLQLKFLKKAGQVRNQKKKQKLEQT